jgi:hypothetical protein
MESLCSTCSIMVAWVKLYMLRGISIWVLKGPTREHMGMGKDSQPEKQC